MRGHKTLTGKVVKIADGNTLTLLVVKTQVKVRLEGIDTPERAQPFGRKAEQALAKKVFGTVIQVACVARSIWSMQSRQESLNSRAHRLSRQGGRPRAYSDWQRLQPDP